MQSKDKTRPSFAMRLCESSQAIHGIQHEALRSYCSSMRTDQVEKKHASAAEGQQATRRNGAWIGAGHGSTQRDGAGARRACAKSQRRAWCLLGRGRGTSRRCDEACLRRRRFRFDGVGSLLRCSLNADAGCGKGRKEVTGARVARGRPSSGQIGWMSSSSIYGEYSLWMAAIYTLTRKQTLHQNNSSPSSKRILYQNDDKTDFHAFGCQNGF